MKLQRVSSPINPGALTFIVQNFLYCWRVHVHGSGVWGNRYRCDWPAGVRRVAV